MKTAILCGITLIAAGPAFAQSSATGAAAGQTDATTVTLTGCVAGGGSEAKPITLSNALIIPGTSQPGQLDQTPSPVPADRVVSGNSTAGSELPPPSATAGPRRRRRSLRSARPDRKPPRPPAPAESA